MLAGNVTRCQEADAQRRQNHQSTLLEQSRDAGKASDKGLLLLYRDQLGYEILSDVSLLSMFKFERAMSG